jgi:DNA-binding transcriptional ArsR family regulator
MRAPAALSEVGPPPSTGTQAALDRTEAMLLQPDGHSVGPPVVTAIETGLDQALRALAEPRRRAILELVSGDELAAGEIAGNFDITRTAISQHLTVLKEAGLLIERRAGTRRLYRARPEGLDELRGLLDGMWASSLDVARQLVEGERAIADAGEVHRAG